MTMTAPRRAKFQPSTPSMSQGRYSAGLSRAPASGGLPGGIIPPASRPEIAAARLPAMARSPAMTGFLPFPRD
jgi:hypothetical protein